MKKFIYLTVIIMAVCLSSCEGNMDLARLDFNSAVCDYEYRRDSLEMVYLKKFQDEKPYRPNINKLKDSITIASRVLVEESFSTLYDNYSDNFIHKVFYHTYGSTLKSKEEFYSYYTNKAVSKVLGNVSLRLKGETIINPTEDDIREFLDNSRLFKSH